MKRFLRAVLFLAAILLTATAVSGAGLGNFRKTNQYGGFSDVGETDWYYENVKAICEYGLMIGKSSDSFDPAGNITYAETITVAARLHAIYHTGSCDFPASDPWYRSYLDYCEKNGIVNTRDPGKAFIADSMMNDRIKRDKFALIISNALDDEALPAINLVETGAIPDVYMRMVDQIDAIYRLYRSGIIVGVDAKGNFLPDDFITRCEAAAILTRAADPALRKSVTLKTLKAEGALTEESVLALIGQMTDDPVQLISLNDFDEDGEKEAFVITSRDKLIRKTEETGRYLYEAGVFTDPDVCDYVPVDSGRLWFVSERGLFYEIPLDGAKLDNDTYEYDDFGPYKVFRYNLGNVSAGASVIFRVTDGYAVMMERPEFDDLYLGEDYSPGRGYTGALLYDRTQKLYFTEGHIEADAYYGTRTASYRHRNLLLQYNPEKDALDWVKVSSENSGLEWLSRP